MKTYKEWLEIRENSPPPPPPPPVQKLTNINPKPNVFTNNDPIKSLLLKVKNYIDANKDAFEERPSGSQLRNGSDLTVSDINNLVKLKILFRNDSWVQDSIYRWNPNKLLSMFNAYGIK